MAAFPFAHFAFLARNNFPVPDAGNQPLTLIYPVISRPTADIFRPAPYPAPYAPCPFRIVKEPAQPSIDFGHGTLNWPASALLPTPKILRHIRHLSNRGEVIKRMALRPGHAIGAACFNSPCKSLTKFGSRLINEPPRGRAVQNSPDHPLPATRTRWPS